MEIQKKSAVLLVHGEKDENTLLANAISSYTYFKNMYRETPRKCELHTVPDNKDLLCEETIGHMHKWLVK